MLGAARDTKISNMYNLKSSVKDNVAEIQIEKQGACVYQTVGDNKGLN